jgi:hypothetical protein
MPTVSLSTGRDTRVLDFFQCCGSGSGSRWANIAHKNRKKVNKFHILIFEVLDVLFWGLKASPVAWS